MKTQLFILFAFLLLVTSCAKKLDDSPLPFNDNPYDNDYTGPKVIRIDSIVNGNFMNSNFVFIFTNRVFYTKLYDNNDGTRLYRNGILINTHYNNTNHTAYFSDINPISGATYTYQLKLFLGSGEAESESISFTTP